MCLAGCLSSNKDALQFTTDLEPSLAVDNNVNTHSCTQSTEAFPWWAVDLGAEYSVLSVTVTLPNTGGDTRIIILDLASFIDYINVKK